MFDHPAFDEHEKVHFASDSATGLRCIVAIHSTRLGPAAGGCRMWPYANCAEAITDVLRLSRGMSYKNAMAGLPLGGGKAVIIGDPARHKSPALFEAFGRIVDGLGGTYITAEDVGVNEADMSAISRQTQHVAGLPRARGAGAEQTAGGNPSPKTARGVLAGIKAALAHVHGTDSLNGRHIAVQGLGGVGGNLCALLHAEGASLTVADINLERSQTIAAQTNAQISTVDEILSTEADVLAPCALGGVLNDQSIAKLNVPIVAGGANNQLLEDRHGDELMRRGILYAPDYVINAGGIINVCGEHIGNWTEAEVDRRVDAIGTTLSAIFQASKESEQATNHVADAMARDRIGLND